MEKRQALEIEQVFHVLEVNGSSRTGQQKIVGIAREPADQQRHVIDQFCHCPQA
ncbi:hypothetical protein D3C78_1814670 [compost metagenome]